LEIAKSVFPEYDGPKQEPKVKVIMPPERTEDTEILLKDECERLQEHLGDREKPNETELEQEALWIWDIL
jgi:hypothetical protein